MIWAGESVIIFGEVIQSCFSDRRNHHGTIRRTISHFVWWNSDFSVVLIVSFTDAKLYRHIGKVGIEYFYLQLCSTWQTRLYARGTSNGYNVELFVTFISYCMETIKSDEALLLNSHLILYNIVIHGQLTTALLDQHVRI